MKEMVMASKAKQASPAAVDGWLAKLPDEHREALERLRKQIKKAAPKIVETVAYGVPMFYDGMTPLFGLNAMKDHVSFGPGGETIDALRAELEGYDVLKHTIRFTNDSPLPAALVKKIVNTRLVQRAASARPVRSASQKRRKAR